MRKALTITVVCLAAVSLGAATTEYDGPTDQPHIMGVDDSELADSVNDTGTHNHTHVQDDEEKILGLFDLFVHVVGGVEGLF